MPEADEHPGAFPQDHRALAGRRKAHRKSRTGCFECRRRHIKCGEQRPQCQACARHDVPCNYPSPYSGREAAVTAASPRPASSPSTTTSTPVSTTIFAATSSQRTYQTLGGIVPSHPAPAVGPSPQSAPVSTDEPCTFNMNDLLLLHHWSLKASRDIYKSDQVDHCWQTVFPRIGFQQPFVMYGILSLASLHLAHVDQASRSRRILDASRHHNLSLQGFRQAIEGMNWDERDNYTASSSDSSSDALFACATLNVIYTLAMLRPSTDEHMSPRARYSRTLGTELIPIIRGVQAVLRPVYDRVRMGPLRPLTDLGNWEELEPGAQTGDEHFQRIRETWAQETLALTQPTDVSLYDATLQILRRCRLYIAQFIDMDDDALRQWGFNRGWAGPLLFLYSAPDEYFNRLNQRHPPALVLFAYFGALLHHLDDFWFVEGWGRDVVLVVDELLGDFWEPWMGWPKRAVGII